MKYDLIYKIVNIEKKYVCIYMRFIYLFSSFYVLVNIIYHNKINIYVYVH